MAWPIIVWAAGALLGGSAATGCVTDKGAVRPDRRRETPMMMRCPPGIDCSFGSDEESRANLTYASQLDHFVSGKTKPRPDWIDNHGSRQLVGRSYCDNTMHDYDLIQSAIYNAVNDHCPKIKLNKGQKIDLRYNNYIAEYGSRCSLLGDTGFYAYVLMDVAEVDRYCDSVQQPDPLTAAKNDKSDWNPYVGAAVKQEIRKTCQKAKEKNIKACVDRVVVKMIESVKAVCHSGASKDNVTVQECGAALMQSPWADLAQLQASFRKPMPHVTQAIDKELLLKGSGGTMHRSLTSFIRWEVTRSLW